VTSQVAPRFSSVVTLSLALVGGLLLAVAAEGPDFGHYTDWAAAALSGDIFTLRGNVLSPGGVPFTLAAAGPGLLFAVTKAALAPLTIGTASLLTGWIAAIVFWCCALVVLRRAADGREWLALFGAAALFVGTHAGFYSHVHATEVFANALIAALWAIALTPRRWRISDSLATGALAGLLLLVRAHVVLYAVPALWIAVFGNRESRQADGAAGVALRLVAVAVPGVVALAEYAVVNDWMTGSVLHPPYVYGGAGFSSVDLQHPEFAAVLGHPWHGLLSYHPLYGISLLAVCVLAIRAKAWRPLWIVTLLAAVAHVWVQAGWYIWWLGGSSFGMRGLAPAALPLVAGLIALVRQDLDERPTRAWLWVSAATLASAWSYPLLLSGYTDFFSWHDLTAAQTPALVAMAGIAIFAIYARVSRASAASAVALVFCVGAVAGFAAAVWYLVWELSMFPAPVTRLILGLAAAGVLIIAARTFGLTNRSGGTWHLQLAPVLKAAAIAIFVVQAGLFVRLAIRTERHVTSGAAPPRDFQYFGASPVDELRVTYAEYVGVPGFEARKAAFRRFLGWQWIAVARMSPEDRRLAEAVWERFQADPEFQTGLVEATAHDGAVRITGSGISDGQQSKARELVLGIPGVRSVTFSTD
jgi:hypothetical protein